MLPPLLPLFASFANILQLLFDVGTVCSVGAGQAPSPRKNHGVMSDVSLSSNTKQARCPARNWFLEGDRGDCPCVH